MDPLYVVTQLTEILCYNPEGRRSIFIDFIFPASGPGVDSASNRNEYQGYLLGGKDGKCVWLTTSTSSCVIV
jgi:hypothetical protein